MVSKNQIINNAIKQGRLILTEIESKKVLKDAGINTIETRLASSQKEAITLGEQIGFPVVLKVASPEPLEL